MIHAFKESGTEDSISAEKDDPYNLSIGEIVYSENKRDSMTVDSSILISPSELNEAIGMSTMAALPDLTISSITSYSTYPFTG